MLDKQSYRPEIDGLRAFAVIAVIINHFNKDILPSGYLGVDIFFVISGFVITSSLSNRPSKSFADFLAEFYTRRIKRLIPALVIFVTLTGLLICLFNPKPDISLRTGAASLFGLSNLYLFRQSTDYFATSTELNVFTHTWSLGVEEQFYILFPFLVWFTGFGRATKKGREYLLWFIGLLSIVSLILFIYLYQSNQPAAYFLMPPRLWELGTGCLLFLALKSSNKFLTLIERIPPSVVVASIIVSFFISLEFACQATIVVVMLAAVMIVCLRKETTTYNLFTHPRVVYIGLISYSLYLWHWGILSLSRWTIGIHWWSVPIQIFLIFWLSVVSYSYVETPLRRSNWSHIRWQSIAYGLGSSASASGLLLLLGTPLHEKIYSGAKYKDFSSVVPKIIDYTGPISGRKAKLCHSSDKKERDSLKGNTNITQAFIHNCLWQGRRDTPLYAFVGDSHTLSLFPLADKLLIQNNLNLFFHSRASCAFPSQGETIRRGCDKVMNSTQTFLIDKFSYKKGGVLITASYLNTHFGYDGGNRWEFLKHPSGTKNDVDNNLDDYIAALSELSSSLSKVGASLVVFAPLPQHPGLLPETCIPLWFRPSFSLPQSCIYTDKAFLRTQREHIINKLKKLESTSENLFVYDPFDLICQSSDKCYSSYGGKPLYADDNHLSLYGIQLIYKDFTSFLVRHKLLAQ